MVSTMPLKKEKHSYQNHGWLLLIFGAAPQIPLIWVFARWVINPKASSGYPWPMPAGAQRGNRGASVGGHLWLHCQQARQMWSGRQMCGPLILGGVPGIIWPIAPPLLMQLLSESCQSSPWISDSAMDHCLIICCMRDSQKEKTLVTLSIQNSLYSDLTQNLVIIQ